MGAHVESVVFKQPDNPFSPNPDNNAERPDQVDSVVLTRDEQQFRELQRAAVGNAKTLSAKELIQSQKDAPNYLRQLGIAPAVPKVAATEQISGNEMQSEAYWIQVHKETPPRVE